MFWTMTNGGQKLNICSLLRVTSSEFENEYLYETFTEDMPLAKPVTRNSITNLRKECDIIKREHPKGHSLS